MVRARTLVLVVAVLAWTAVDLAARQEVLRVLPAGEIRLTAARGASDVPVSAALRLLNGAPGKAEWRASSEQDWLELSPATGSLRSGEQGDLTVSIDPERAAQLPAGEHVARIDFALIAGGRAEVTRRVVLRVRETRGLVVTPAPPDRPVRLTEAGQRLSYQLANDATAPLDWSVHAGDARLSAAPESGTLAPNESATVTITLDRATSADRPLARRRVAVTFLNRTGGAGTSLRVLELEGEPAASDQVLTTERRSSVSQFGITWTFDRAYEVGRFAGGDWWVLGPCLVVEIDPPSKPLRDGQRTTNGSMINPSPRLGQPQGYDSAMYGQYADAQSYQPRLNDALNVSFEAPLVLRTHSSLVSSISDPKAGQLPQLRTAAILTVLDAPAPDGSFRPPYAGRDKRVRYSTRDLDRARLPRLAPVPSTPPPAEVERMFARPWIDHVTGWFGGYVHPRLNMPNYGRDMTDHVSTAALMLMLDLPLEQKELLLTRFVQLGIDFFGILQDGGSWPPQAGHLNGRKWPILFAGLMLGDDEMQCIGETYGPETFSEDGHTFYVEAPRPKQGYGPEHVGMPEWGSSHATKPRFDDVRWEHTEPFPAGATHEADRTQDVKYRLCCTANTWWGQLLAAYAMDAKELWNHPALFDYQDRFLEVNRAAGITDYRLRWRPFYLDMWLRHRPSYGAPAPDADH